MVQTRRFLLLGGGAAGLALFAGCSTLDRGGAVAGRVVTQDAIERVNAFRTANGQTPLRIDRTASEAALAHARTMAEHRRMAHNIGRGADFLRRMKRQNVALPAA